MPGALLCLLSYLFSNEVQEISFKRVGMPTLVAAASTWLWRSVTALSSTLPGCSSGLEVDKCALDQCPFRSLEWTFGNIWDPNDTFDVWTSFHTTPRPVSPGLLTHLGNFRPSIIQTERIISRVCATTLLISRQSKYKGHAWKGKLRFFCYISCQGKTRLQLFLNLLKLLRGTAQIDRIVKAWLLPSSCGSRPAGGLQ